MRTLVVICSIAALILPGQRTARAVMPWYEGPALKYVEDTGFRGQGTQRWHPHYWNLAAGHLYVGAYYNISGQYSVADLTAASSGDEVSVTRSLNPGDLSEPRPHKWKSPAANSNYVLWNDSNGNKHSSLPVEDAWSNATHRCITTQATSTGSDIYFDTADFSSDSSYLFTDEYNGAYLGGDAKDRSRIHRYDVGDLGSTTTEQLTNEASFVTSAARVRNLGVYDVGTSTDLIYYGEGSSSEPTGGNVWVHQWGGAETLLISLSDGNIFCTDDIVNVKVAGLAAGDPNLYVMDDAGNLGIYDLAADGLSLVDPIPIRTFTPAQLDAILGAGVVLGNHSRVFEVTDDESHTFFSKYIALNGDPGTDNIYVVWGIPEPATVVLLVCGLAALLFGALIRRRRRRA